MARLKVGIVVSTKMAKTVVVEVLSVRRHPIYLKAVRRTKKFHVHDEVGVKLGDRVEFKEVAPISATKRWKIVGVVGTRQKTEDGGQKAEDRRRRTEEVPPVSRVSRVSRVLRGKRGEKIEK